MIIIILLLLVFIFWISLTDFWSGSLKPTVLYLFFHFFPSVWLQLLCGFAFFWRSSVQTESTELMVRFFNVTNKQQGKQDRFILVCVTETADFAETQLKPSLTWTHGRLITSLVFHLSRSLGSPDSRGRHSSSLLGRNIFLGPLFSAQRGDDTESAGTNSSSPSGAAGPSQVSSHLQELCTFHCTWRWAQAAVQHSHTVRSPGWFLYWWRYLIEL